jgi:hypothetical protein
MVVCNSTTFQRAPIKIDAVGPLFVADIELQDITSEACSFKAA